MHCKEKFIAKAKRLESYVKPVVPPLLSTCLSCDASFYAEYNYKSKKHIRTCEACRIATYHTKYTNDEKYKIIAQLLTKVKNRCKRKGVPYNIDVDYVLSYCMPDNDVCPITGKPLDWTMQSRDKPSIDKIIPELGYTKDNVKIISLAGNILKLNNSLATLRNLVTYMEAALSKAA